MHYRRSNFAVIALLCLTTWSFCGLPVHTWPEEKKDIPVILEWSRLEYDYTSQDRQADIDSGVFNVGHIAPIDVDVYYREDGRASIFITVPRTVQNGVPASLGTVSDKKLNGNPMIVPYPSWSWHRNLEECRPNRIVSVFRIMIDECGRLWVLDTGKLENSQTCPAQILAFDLKTNQLIYKYEIPSSLLSSSSLLITPVVDVFDTHNGCKNTFIYSADCQHFTLIVHDVMRNASWAVRDKSFYPDPDYGTYNIAGESFDLMDGILGMSLSQNRPEERRLFYHAMSSSTENWVNIDHLRNQSLFKNNPEAAPHIFHTYPRKRFTQSAAEAIDRNGILYYGLLGDVKIACFNTRGDYGSRRSSDIVGNNKVTMQFPTGIKVINDERGKQQLWILTSAFQRVATGSLNGNETNFRILAAGVDLLISGTSCK